MKHRAYNEMCRSFLWVAFFFALVHILTGGWLITTAFVIISGLQLHQMHRYRQAVHAKRRASEALERLEAQQ